MSTSPKVRGKSPRREPFVLGDQVAAVHGDELCGDERCGIEICGIELCGIESIRRRRGEGG